VWSAVFGVVSGVPCGARKCEEGDSNPHGCYPTSPSSRSRPFAPVVPARARSKNRDIVCAAFSSVVPAFSGPSGSISVATSLAVARVCSVSGLEEVWEFRCVGGHGYQIASALSGRERLSLGVHRVGWRRAAGTPPPAGHRSELGHCECLCPRECPAPRGREIF
jgi:hypothetical protein